MSFSKDITFIIPKKVLNFEKHANQGLSMGFCYLSISQCFIKSLKLSFEVWAKGAV